MFFTLLKHPSDEDGPTEYKVVSANKRCKPHEGWQVVAIVGSVTLPDFWDENGEEIRATQYADEHPDLVGNEPTPAHDEEVADPPGSVHSV